MTEVFASLNPVIQALIGTIFTWFMTALGAAVIFLFSEVSQKILDGMLGFAAGVMIAASYWSLLEPAIKMSEEALEAAGGVGLPAWFPAAVGFMAGGIFLRLVDNYLPHLHLFNKIEDSEGIKTSWQRSVLLVLAITLHNIPEGLAIGVAFGAVAAGLPSASLAGAIALAIGIGIQNFPEGLAVSAPLYRDGVSKWKSFMYGQLSGAVEPLAAVIGAGAVIYSRPILPYALAFAAGAMIFVVAEECIPESHKGGNSDIATMGVMIGFTLMMILDVALG